MLHRLIRKGGKPLGILLIISTLCNTSFCQKQSAHIDSVSLKKEIDSVLARYGLKSKGFVINVISLNQKGGQTAYSITNNFYGDTVRSEKNYGFDTLTEAGVKYLYVYLRRGTWQSPFVGYDSLLNDISFDPGIGVSATSHSSILFNNPNYGTLHKTMWTFSSHVCSRTLPLKIGPLKPGAFVIFGDYADPEKIYFYQNGKVTHTPTPE
ncbi:hypothetical protein [Paraflavitalea sp. CAU 1676]|uniref:hypothetical protein n=1 Tax=Paraflavitalea sp. CAU 1676 TaxID=3032598 RepID=UPI0023DB9051|nr:hypothetical protein [Paraflavitalea sp. CAU 1676]MDF2192570.1 hypothetical protein [Paraflavitalea sp. CAU 1676]